MPCKPRLLTYHSLIALLSACAWGGCLGVQRVCGGGQGKGGGRGGGGGASLRVLLLVLSRALATTTHIQALDDEVSTHTPKDRFR